MRVFSSRKASRHFPKKTVTETRPVNPGHSILVLQSQSHRKRFDALHHPSPWPSPRWRVRLGARGRPLSCTRERARVRACFASRTEPGAARCFWVIGGVFWAVGASCSWGLEKTLTLALSQFGEYTKLGEGTWGCSPEYGIADFVWSPEYRSGDLGCCATQKGMTHLR